MTVERDETGRPPVARLSGSLDAHSVAEFESVVESLIEIDGGRVILDLERLEYLSSAGIGAIMALQHRLKRDGGEAVLVRPCARVTRLLEMLGFTRIFSIVETPEAAFERPGRPSGA